MSLSNKEVLDLYDSIGAQETVTHLILLLTNACHGSDPESIRKKLLSARRKQDQLKKSASRPKRNMALEAFRTCVFHVPLRQSIVGQG